jgi:hypothetical protein
MVLELLQKTKIFIVITSLLLSLTCMGGAMNASVRAANNEYRSKAVFFQKPDGALLAVLENGQAVKVENPDNIPLYSGCRTDDLLVQADGIDGDVARASYPYALGRQVPVMSDYGGAPQSFAKYLLENLVCNGTPAAVDEYQLNSVKVKNRFNNGRIDATVNFDARPCRNSYAYGPPSSDGWVHNISRDFTIYGANNMWLLGNEEAVYKVDGKEPQLKKTTSPSAGDRQQLLYASEFYSYYSEKTYLLQTGLDRKNGVPLEYETSIWSVNHKTGLKNKIHDGKRNLDYQFADYVDNKLFLVSSSWKPYSEGGRDEMACIDEGTQQYGKLLDSAWILSTVEKTAYVCQADKVYGVDLENAKVYAIGSLPEPVGEQNPLKVCHTKNGVMKILYVSEPPVCYEFNLKSGEYEKLPYLF